MKATCVDDIPELASRVVHYTNIYLFSPRLLNSTEQWLQKVVSFWLEKFECGNSPFYSPVLVHYWASDNIISGG